MGRSNYHNGQTRDRCYFCPQRHDLEEHHIVPVRFGGVDAKANIVTVCERCHKKLERLYDARFYEHFGIADETGERKAHHPCDMNDCESGEPAERVMKNTEGDRGALMCRDCAEAFLSRTPEYDTLADATHEVVRRADA